MRFSTAGEHADQHEALLTAFRRCRDRLATTLAETRSQGRWQDPTACDAWDRHALAVHLRWAQESLAAIQGADVEQREAPGAGIGDAFDPAETPQRYVDHFSDEDPEETAASLLAAFDANVARFAELADATIEARSVWGAPVDFRLMVAHCLWDHVCHELDLSGPTWDARAVDPEDLAQAAGYSLVPGSLGVAMTGAEGECTVHLAAPATTVRARVEGGVVTVEVTPADGPAEGAVPAVDVLAAITGRADAAASEVLGLGRPFSTSVDGFRGVLTGGR